MGKKKDVKKKIKEIRAVNIIDFMLGLQRDELPDNSIWIIVDDNDRMMLGKVKILPMKEEEITVQKKYTLRGHKKEEI